MGTAVISEAGNAASAFAGVLGSAITSVGAMFWDKTTGLTVLGGLLAVTLGIGVVYGVFRLVKGLAQPHVGR
jgi:hypothetical protein